VKLKFFDEKTQTFRASTSIDGPRSRVAHESGASASGSSSNFIATGDHRIFERIEQPGGAEFATFDHQNAGMNKL
jgi:hypothetical protein